MHKSKLFTIYSHLPVWVQNTACSIAGLGMRHKRYGKDFKNYLDFINKSQWWSLSDQEVYQNEQVAKIIKHSYDTVPYYRKIMDSRKLSPSDIESVADLQKLPILTKQDVRSAGKELCSVAIPKSKWIHGHTGGTTGTSLQLYSSSSTFQRQWAVWWRHRMRFGLSAKDEFIVFAGRDVIPLTTMDPPFWRKNIPMHQTYVSIHHMTKDNMGVLVEYLNTRNVKYYSGYPSAVYLVAKYIQENGIKLKTPPKVVVLGAETLLPHQRRAMKEAFGSVVTDQYGASENCGNISECECGRYHVDMEFGAIEFIPMKHVPTTTRRIVCTGFCNYVMPLIRYDIGDIATIPTSEIKCQCGRQAPTVERIDGRIESYILTPDGRQAGRLDFIFKNSANIEEAQLVQTEIESVTVRIVRGPGYTENDESDLLASLRKYLGNIIEIHVEYIDSIPREANGKFRQIVSSIFKKEQEMQDFKS